MRNSLPVSFLMVLFFSCSNNDASKNNESQDQLLQSNDGNAISYTDSRIGDTTLLFVHGWGINQTYWQAQRSYFSDWYRVVTLDLPGFGESGKKRSDWTIENYGRDITVLLDSLDLKNVVLIGHSMSGAVVLEAALLNPSRVLGVVGVDNFKDLGVELTPELLAEWAVFYDTARNNYKQIITETFSQYFFAPGTPQEVRKRVISDISNGDPQYVIDILQQADQYPVLEKMKQFNKTIHLINSDFAATDTQAIQKQDISYRLWNMGPTGHYPMIEEPTRFNRLLQEAVLKMGSNTSD